MSIVGGNSYILPSAVRFHDVSVFVVRCFQLHGKEGKFNIPCRISNMVLFR